jgi:hypothetical protein
VADVIVNLMLFVPLGAGVAMVAGRVSTSALVALGVTLMVELAQQAIPGRDPSLRDLLFNSLGGLGGGAIVPVAAAVFALDARRTARLAILAALGFGAIVAVTGVLTGPALPDSTYFGQWTPRLGHLASYAGRVLEVRIGGTPVGRRRIDNAVVREAFLGGEPLEIVVLAAPPPPEVAPIFSVFDRRRREILLVGADGPDLVLHLRTRSRDLRLDQPDLRLWGALQAYSPGDTLRISVARAEPGLCAEVNGEGKCGIGVTAGSGWTLLYSLQSSPRWARSWLGRIWLMALLFPLGILMRWRWEALAGVTLAAFALLALPAWVGLQPAPPGELLAAIGGLLAGLLLRRRFLGYDVAPEAAERPGGLRGDRGEVAPAQGQAPADGSEPISADTSSATQRSMRR